MAAIRIGISGWRYKPWRGTFYPRKLPQHDELKYAAGILGVIEINGSFYSLQRPSSYARWYPETPKGFVFTVKGPRYITHMLRLKNVETPLANFFASGLFNLREKLGPILWQFPPHDPLGAVELVADFASRRRPGCGREMERGRRKSAPLLCCREVRVPCT